MKKIVLALTVFLTDCSPTYPVIPPEVFLPAILVGGELSGEDYYNRVDDTYLEHAKSTYFNRGDMEVAYRLLEDGLISEDGDTRYSHTLFLDDHPEILEAAQHTFSVEALVYTLSIRENEAEEIEERRLYIYKTVATDDRYQKALNNFNFVFSGQYQKFQEEEQEWLGDD